MSAGAPASRGRLGKGLGALLGDDVLSPGRDDPGLRTVALRRISPNPLQPRREFQAEELEELRESIRENGLLQPLVLRPHPGRRGEYQLVAGERRMRALTQLGWETVPALIRELDDRALLVLALVENIQRAELGPLEEAEGYRALVEEFGLTQAEVARAVGKSRPTVANLLRLLTLPAGVRRMLEEGVLSMGHARALLSLEHPGRMIDLARRAADEGWSVREVEKRCRTKSEEPPSRPTAARPESRTETGRSPEVRALEDALQEFFGTRVVLRPGAGESGEIRIPFRSNDDFARLFRLLTGDSVRDVVG
jgi:ParB family transcriptional regulator, chromosome partitioning protein